MMRYGPLDPPDDAAERPQPRQLHSGPTPASEWVPEIAAMTSMTSPRLRRAAEYFAALEELLHDVRWQVELELAPFAELVERQQSTMRETLSNLEPQLRPLKEYVEAEEANLSALESNMNDADMGFLSRSFAKHAELLRERIGETRRHIDAQRAPFMRYDEDTRDAIEVALSRLDGDLGALEHNLVEQRRVMQRLLEAMRSETFVAVKELLLGREAVLEELARGGVTDPAEIVACVQVLRADLPAAGGGAHLQRVLAATDAADERLAGAAGFLHARRGAVRSPRPATAEVEGAGADHSA
jgi:hypothetical protein